MKNNRILTLAGNQLPTYQALSVKTFLRADYLRIALSIAGLLFVSAILTVPVALADGFIAAKFSEVGKRPRFVAAADFNRDGKPDLVTANYDGNNVSVLISNGNGTFQTGVSYSVGTKPTSIAVGDFNGDAKLDLAVAGYSTYNNISVLLGKGDGTFQAAINYSGNSNPKSVAVGDFNRDRKQDLVVANQSSGDVTIMLNDPGPSLSITDVTVTEGDGGTVNAIFTVKLAASSTQTVSVRYATANGTATSSSDFMAKNGTLSFAPGQTTQTITVALIGDTLVEANETFRVNLSVPTNAVITDGIGICTIVNDD